jgi:hypothetical protein
MTSFEGDELALVRMRNHGRTYWIAADREQRMDFAPHITRQVAIERFKAASGRAHARIVLYHKHHTPQQAQRLLTQLFKAQQP